MLQFGTARPDHVYAPRPTAFGLLVHEGRLACVRIDRGANSYLDLPGGARDGQETEAEAVVREYREETGLRVGVGERLTEHSSSTRATVGPSTTPAGSGR